MTFNNCREGERPAQTPREEFLEARIDALVDKVRFLETCLAQAKAYIHHLKTTPDDVWDGSDIGESA